MSVERVGDIYINVRRLSGVTEVQRNEVPHMTEASFSFMILLEGGDCSVVMRDKDKAIAAHDDLAARINPGFRFSGGGVTLAAPGVNSIGAISNDPGGGSLPAGFSVGMDGVNVNLRYADEAKAETDRKKLIDLVNKWSASQ